MRMEGGATPSRRRRAYCSTLQAGLQQRWQLQLLLVLIVLLFALALVAVSARIWLPGDMLAPAPVG